MKFYAVKIGLQPSIYTTWDKCKENVTGYSGAIFKSFLLEDDAKDYMAEEIAPKPKKPMKKDAPKIIVTADTFAFIDGSFNPKTNVYGFGGFLKHNVMQQIKNQIQITFVKVPGHCGNVSGNVDSGGAFNCGTIGGKIK